MGVLVEQESKIREAVESALSAVDLRLAGIIEVQRLNSLDELSKWDDHLAANIAALEPGKRVVWGTIHTYYADGEA